MNCSDKQKSWICDAILTALPGADSNQLERTFSRKVDEFLQQSASWLEEDTFVADSLGKVKIDFSRIGGQMVWIEKVWFRTRPLRHATTIPPEYAGREGSWPMVYTNTPYPDVIELHPIPREDENRAVLVRAALTLDECAEEDICIPDWVFSRYKEAIRTGVLGDMMRELSKPYTNLVEGRLNTRTFNHWVAKARDEAHRGFGKHESEWQYPRQFSA